MPSSYYYYFSSSYLMVWNSNIEDIALLKQTNTVVAILSTAGSLWAAYYSSKTLSAANTSVKFIFAITLSDFLFSIANLMSIFEDETLNTPFCHVEAFIRESSWILSLFFSTALAVFCYKSCSRGYALNQERFFKMSLLIGLLLCLVMTTLPLLTKFVEYQNSDLYCQIIFPRDATYAGILMAKLIYVGIPIISGTLITFGSYFLTMKNIKSLSKSSPAPYKLFWYPALMFLTFTPCFVYSFTIACLRSNENIVIKVVHLTLTHSIGLTNAILYGVQLKQAVSRFNSHKLTQESFLPETPRISSIY